MDCPLFVLAHRHRFFFTNASNYKPFWTAPFLLSSPAFHNPSYFKGNTQILLRRWIHWIRLFVIIVVLPLENHTFFYDDGFVIFNHISNSSYFQRHTQNLTRGGFINFVYMSDLLYFLRKTIHFGELTDSHFWSYFILVTRPC